MRIHHSSFKSALAVLIPLITVALISPCESAAAPEFTLTTFEADVTPPVGHALMGGGIAPAAKVDDPLIARGFVLSSTEKNAKPIVVCAVDWCEIRNDAYEQWRTSLAEAVGTDIHHVLVMSIHQHDAPIADLTAQKILDESNARGKICNLKFHDQAVQRVTKAAKNSLLSPKRVTHIGTGQARVKMIASNRRYIDDDGKPRYDRFSATRIESIRSKPEGDIDPFLKTLSFWNGEKPILALSAYATHPMSYYGKGGVSGDFVAIARRQRDKEDPGVFQMYVSGCSGNVTAGKYNDGSANNRPVLAERLHGAMKQAWQATKRQPLTQATLRVAPLKLKPRNDAGFSVEQLKKRLAHERTPFGQCLAALGLSWRLRADGAGHAIDVPAIDFGTACFLLMPAESYVEFQLAAQKVRPKTFVVVAGYGECGPGYIPIERAWRENDSNLRDWCWVSPGAEALMMEAMKKVLKQENSR